MCRLFLINCPNQDNASISKPQRSVSQVILELKQQLRLIILGRNHILSEILGDVMFSVSPSAHTLHPFLYSYFSNLQSPHPQISYPPINLLYLIIIVITRGAMDNTEQFHHLNIHNKIHIQKFILKTKLCIYCTEMRTWNFGVLLILLTRVPLFTSKYSYFPEINTIKFQEYIFSV